MSVTEEGFLGSLTPDQEVKLRAAWVHLLRLCGQTIPDLDTPSVPDKSSRFLQQLSNKTPEGFRLNLWRFIVNDHPDATVLRFLRARKWDVEVAVEMLVSAVNWRAEIKIDENIVQGGEGVGLAASPARTDVEFLEQYRSGKSYARCTDKQGRAIYIVRVRLHDPPKQSAEAMERYILHSIESLRLLVRPPIDRACLIFDMTGFGLKNMDYHVVKFLVSVFEARYPETLGAVLVHNAPFVFWGIWNVVKRWLDPVIAGKISFTKTKADLLQFVSQENLQTHYGGEDKWEYKYPEPVPGENDRLNDQARLSEAQAERDALISSFEKLTTTWAVQKDESHGKERDAAAQEVIDSYWKLDPYIRARNLYHRAGILDAETGKVNFKVAQ